MLITKNLLELTVVVLSSVLWGWLGGLLAFGGLCALGVADIWLQYRRVRS